MKKPESFEEFSVYLDRKTKEEMTISGIALIILCVNALLVYFDLIPTSLGIGLQVGVLFGWIGALFAALDPTDI